MPPQDVTVLEEVVKMLLEIVNSCLTAQLAHNAHLVYALLYKRDAIRACQGHAAFQDIARNIDTVGHRTERRQWIGGCQRLDKLAVI